jgi:hypothetical protein
MQEATSDLVTALSLDRQNRTILRIRTYQCTKDLLERATPALARAIQSVSAGITRDAIEMNAATKALHIFNNHPVLSGLFATALVTGGIALATKLTKSGENKDVATPVSLVSLESSTDLENLRNLAKFKDTKEKYDKHLNRTQDTKRFSGLGVQMKQSKRLIRKVTLSMKNSIDSLDKLNNGINQDRQNLERIRNVVTEMSNFAEEMEGELNELSAEEKKLGDEITGLSKDQLDQISKMPEEVREIAMAEADKVIIDCHLKKTQAQLKRGLNKLLDMQKTSNVTRSSLQLAINRVNNLATENSGLFVAAMQENPDEALLHIAHLKSQTKLFKELVTRGMAEQRAAIKSATNDLEQKIGSVTDLEKSFEDLQTASNVFATMEAERKTQETLAETAEKSLQDENSTLDKQNAKNESFVELPVPNQDETVFLEEKLKTQCKANETELKKLAGALNISSTLSQESIIAQAQERLQNANLLLANDNEMAVAFNEKETTHAEAMKYEETAVKIEEKSRNLVARVKTQEEYKKLIEPLKLEVKEYQNLIKRRHSQNLLQEPDLDLTRVKSLNVTLQNLKMKKSDLEQKLDEDSSSSESGADDSGEKKSHRPPKNRQRHLLEQIAHHMISIRKKIYSLALAAQVADDYAKADEEYRCYNSGETALRVLLARTAFPEELYPIGRRLLTMFMSNTDKSIQLPRIYNHHIHGLNEAQALYTNNAKHSCVSYMPIGKESVVFDYKDSTSVDTLATPTFAPKYVISLLENILPFENYQRQTYDVKFSGSEFFAGHIVLIIDRLGDVSFSDDTEELYHGVIIISSRIMKHYCGMRTETTIPSLQMAVREAGELSRRWDLTGSHVVFAVQRNTRKVSVYPYSYGSIGDRINIINIENNIDDRIAHGLIEQYTQCVECKHVKLDYLNLIIPGIDTDFYLTGDQKMYTTGEHQMYRGNEKFLVTIQSELFGARANVPAFKKQRSSSLRDWIIGLIQKMSSTPDIGAFLEEQAYSQRTKYNDMVQSAFMQVTIRATNKERFDCWKDKAEINLSGNIPNAFLSEDMQINQQPVSWVVLKARSGSLQQVHQADANDSESFENTDILSEAKVKVHQHGQDFVTYYKNTVLSDDLLREAMNALMHNMSETEIWTIVEKFDPGKWNSVFDVVLLLQQFPAVGEAFVSLFSLRNRNAKINLDTLNALVDSAKKFSAPPRSAIACAPYTVMPTN